MCSRFAVTSPPEAIRRYFEYRNLPNFPPRYNIAPTQPIAAVRIDAQGSRELVLLRWGLIPSWVKDPRDFTTLINARSETVLTKPSFRSAIRHRRCLIPADGFYEWKGARGDKKAFLIKPSNDGPIAFAVLWEHWQGPDGSEIESAVILTTDANQTLAPVHNRMPSVIRPADFEAWLNCGDISAKEAVQLLQPAPDDLFKVVEVSARINNPRNDDPDVQEPLQGHML